MNEVKAMQSAAAWVIGPALLLLTGSPPAVAAAPAALGHDQTVVTGARSFRECGDCPEMLVIPAGHFVMGSPAGEEGRFASEGPQHPVNLRWFALAKDDVTVEEFAAFVKATDYEQAGCDWPRGAEWDSPGFLAKDPVVCVSWQDARAYIAWLNRKVGGTPNGPYRLPSEAEWEYAARAGTATARWWGEGIGHANANCNGCGSAWDNRQIAPAGSFPANPFGLYDMLGNVWQWTADCWNETYQGAPADGRARTAGDCSERVLRGGSWSNLPKFLRAAARTHDKATSHGSDYATYAGFRVARTLPGEYQPK